MTVQSIDEKNFETEVINSELPVLIDFWAVWCGPCKEIAPILDEINNEINKKIKIVKINIDESPNISSKYGVQSIPTLIILKKGEIVATKVGSSLKSDILSWIGSVI